jgi:hypothetical protein
MVLQLQPHVTPAILDDESRNSPSHSSPFPILSRIERFFVFFPSFFGSVQICKSAEQLKTRPLPLFENLFLGALLAFLCSNEKEKKNF